MENRVKVAHQLWAKLVKEESVDPLVAAILVAGAFAAGSGAR